MPDPAPARWMLDACDMNIIRIGWAFPLTITGLLLACGGNTGGPAVSGTSLSPGVTAPQGEADDAVVDRLTSARCDQEQGCTNIGPGRKFASRSVCMEKIHGGIANDLNGYNCPRGLDSLGVDRCVAAIRSEECNDPLETLTRDDKCRTGALCMR